jgi:osmotically-inducible protein OsmY
VRPDDRQQRANRIVDGYGHQFYAVHSRLMECVEMHEGRKAVMRWLKSIIRKSTTRAVEWSVRRALGGEPRLRDLDAPRIRVSVEGDGVVVLAGAVCTREVRELAERVARRVRGVAALRNELKTDDELTVQLKRVLSLDPRTRSLAKDAVVLHGIAELRGSATYDTQLAAIKMAMSIDGIRDVANVIRLATSVPAADLGRAA